MKDNDNLTIERPTFVTHLECAMEGDHYPADEVTSDRVVKLPKVARRS